MKYLMPSFITDPASAGTHAMHAANAQRLQHAQEINAAAHEFFSFTKSPG
jgi:hypothetical protein